MIYQNLSKDQGAPRFEKMIGDILAEVKPGGALEVKSPLKNHTDRQRRWYKGVCLPWLFKHEVINKNQESPTWWDLEVKKECNGLKFLKLEYKQWADGSITSRLTTKGVGKIKMRDFIEEILAMSVQKNWGIAPPDRELRK